MFFSSTACKLNVHKRCQKNVANNCGIDTRNMAQILQEMGITGDKITRPPKKVSSSESYLCSTCTDCTIFMGQVKKNIRTGKFHVKHDRWNQPRILKNCTINEKLYFRMRKIQFLICKIIQEINGYSWFAFLRNLVIHSQTMSDGFFKTYKPSGLVSSELRS